MSHETMIVERRKGLIPIDFAELWRYRELFGFLVWRNVIIRYKQTVVGIAWAVLRPLLTMIVFTIVFGRIAKLPSGGIPYPILTLAALLPWQFFANSLTESSNSLVNNAGMISKIYFPRLIMPTSAVLSGIVDFIISFILLGMMMVWYGIVPSVRMLWLPLFFSVALVSSLGVGLWLSALNVAYRDVKYVVPFLVQFGLYISPVGFSTTVVPQKWRTLYSLNPMVGVIDGFRWCLFGDRISLYLPGILISSIMVLFLLVTGVFYFRKTERTFADII